MRFTYKLLLVIMLISLLAGCKKNRQEFQGLVFQINESRILVVEGIDSAAIPYDEWFKQGKAAIWFSVSPKTVITDSAGKRISLSELQPGLKVVVSHSGPLLTSYPMQGGADRIRAEK